MERKPTRPVPSDKKKPDEVGLVLAAIRQSVDTREGRTHRERFEHEEVIQEKQEEREKEQWEASLPQQNHEQEIPTGPYDELVQQSDRFDKLMTYWQSLGMYDPEKHVDLAWLETNVGPHFDWLNERVLVETKCPFHRSEELKALNPEAKFGPRYCRCPVENCPVWLSTEIGREVLKELRKNTHPEVRAKITALHCQCSCVPRMKLSRTDKNFHRVFLTCGQVNPCRYFQWMHEPLWKPKRPSQTTKEQTKVPRKQQMSNREVLKGWWR